MDGPRWSPKGDSLLVSSESLLDVQGIFSIDVESGQATAFVSAEPGERLVSPRWAPDCRSIYFLRVWGKTGLAALVRRDIATGTEIELLRGTDLTRFLDISPDGGRLAMIRPPNSIVLLATDGQGTPEVIYRSPERVKRLLDWARTPDGDDYLFFGTRGDELWRLHVESREVGRVARLEGLHHIDIHVDGRRLAFTSTRYGQRLEVMRNFLPAP